MIIASDFFTFMALVPEAEHALRKGNPHNRNVVVLCRLFREPIWGWFDITTLSSECIIYDIIENIKSRLYRYSSIVKILYREHLLSISALHNISALIAKTLRSLKDVVRNWFLCLSKEKIIRSLTIKIMYGVIS